MRTTYSGNNGNGGGGNGGGNGGVEDIQTFNDNLKQCTTSDKFASKLVIATMVVCGTLSSPVDLLGIYDYYNLNKELYDTFKLKYVPSSKKTEGEQKVKAFYNSLGVTFYHCDPHGVSTKISAKIFPNGSIQLPGCGTNDAAHKGPEIIHNFIADVDSRCKSVDPESNIIKYRDKFKLQNVRVVMINSNFSFSKCIMQEKIKTLINTFRFDGHNDPENVWRIANYQPDKYSGVNARIMTDECRAEYGELFLAGKKIPLKIKGQVSVLLFSSGKGTITGARSTADLLFAYNHIVNLVRTHQTNVLHGPLKCIVE